MIYDIDSYTWVHPNIIDNHNLFNGLRPKN